MSAAEFLRNEPGRNADELEVAQTDRGRPVRRPLEDGAVPGLYLCAVSGHPCKSHSTL